jgi:hypothetical protein
MVIFALLSGCAECRYTLVIFAKFIYGTGRTDPGINPQRMVTRTDIASTFSDNMWDLLSGVTVPHIY